MPPPKKAKADLDEYGLPPVIKTEALCFITNLSSRRLHQLVSDARIPMEVKAGDGLWHTALAFREIFGYYRRQADRAKPQGDKDIEAQVSIEDLRSRRIKNAKMARELLPRHVYVETWGELLSVFKNRWMNFGDKMALRVSRAKDKVEAAEIMNKEVADIFGGLCDPRVMEDIEAKIRDDEFDPTEDGAESEATSDLVAADSQDVPEGDTGVSPTSPEA